MVKSYYQWDDILNRILNVYNSVDSDPVEPVHKRLRNFWNFDILTGLFFMFIVIICHILSVIYSRLVPVSKIDLAPEFDYDKSFNRNKLVDSCDHGKLS